MSDAIDAAVDKVAAQVDMLQVQVPLPSGRPMVVALPRDVTDEEALQSVGGLLMAIAEIRKQRPRHGLVVANGILKG